MTIEILNPECESTVSLLTPAQKLYQMIPRETREVLYADENFRHQLATVSINANPVIVKWRVLDAPSGAKLIYKVSVELAKAATEDVASTFVPCRPASFHGETAGDVIEVWNLEIARKYICRVVACDGDEKLAEAESSFYTEDFAPRLLKVDNVPNFRDFGGRIGLNGRRVRQGILYRSQGLNFNAHAVCYTEEEILASENGPVLAAERDLMRADISEMERLKADAGAIKFVHAEIGDDWTVFKFEDNDLSYEQRLAVRSLREVPDGEFLGASPLIRTAKAGVVSIPIVIPLRTAVFMREFQADGDGYVALSCGADWWYEVICNGEVSYTRFLDGNGCFVSPDSHKTLLKVKKGSNFLAIVVKAGSEGWNWCYKTLDSFDPEELVVSRIRGDNGIVDGIFKNFVKEIIPGENRLTDEGRRYLLEEVGLRTELDIRSAGECYGMTGSPLGDRVKWIMNTSHAYVRPGTPAWDGPFKKNFEILLDESVYPLDFHCIGGRDRTGILAAMLGMLLGVSEDEMCLEWEITSYKIFDMNFIHKDTYDIFKNGLAEYPGETWTEKAENYVLSIGFTREDINHFREMFLEPLVADCRHDVWKKNTGPNL